MNPEDILSAINRISSNTVEQLEQFSNFEWEAPSRCHMWANKDVAAHLVATLGFNLIQRPRDVHTSYDGKKVEKWEFAWEHVKENGWRPLRLSRVGTFDDFKLEMPLPVFRGWGERTNERTRRRFDFPETP